MLSTERYLIISMGIIHSKCYISPSSATGSSPSLLSVEDAGTETRLLLGFLGDAVNLRLMDAGAACFVPVDIDGSLDESAMKYNPYSWISVCTVYVTWLQILVHPHGPN